MRGHVWVKGVLLIRHSLRSGLVLPPLARLQTEDRTPASTPWQYGSTFGNRMSFSWARCASKGSIAQRDASRTGGATNVGQPWLTFIGKTLRYVVE